MVLNKSQSHFLCIIFYFEIGIYNIVFGSLSTSLTVPGSTSSGLLFLAGFLVHRRCQFVERSGDSLQFGLDCFNDTAFYGFLEFVGSPLQLLNSSRVGFVLEILNCFSAW